MSNEETIFAEALGKGPGVERDAYLAQACAGNAKLREEVDALLSAHEKAGGVLEAPPAGLQTTKATARSSEAIGAMIGPYKLLEQIGGGGMGVVFMAEQLRPVRRKVALKIIKPGMDSHQVIARFEAERQALTMMDHPNIAKVLDAGTTDAGRPYFVMDLVKGVPITDYCDEARLDTRQRLELFIQVCHAVQHAHQKGIIHRDLKPSNVLVTLHDDKPVPKVIDFGIAKATGQVLTDKTLFTNYAQMLGTPLYMSPEQAQISGLDVDTRSDVYSLGVLLYELLTGTTPFDKQRLREAAYDEMRRIIREEEPPRPSTRLSSMGDRIASISAQRHTEPKKLSQLLHGELDWIAMKALEKDRARRYETANGLARDVERHLHDEAVQACPPSGIYRFGKFARRNKVPLAMIGGSAAALLLLLVLAVVSNVRISRALIQKDDALAAARASEAAAKEQERKANAERVRAEGYFLKVRTIVDQMVRRLQATDVARVPQVEKLRTELVRDLMSYYDSLLNKTSTQPADLYGTARAYRMTGELHVLLNERAKAEEDLRSGIAILEKLAEQFPNDADSRQVLATSNNSLAKLLQEDGRFDEAEKAFRHAIGIWSKLAISIPNAAHYRAAINNCHGLLFRLLKEHGAPGDAEQAYRAIVVGFENDVEDFPADPAKQVALVDAWRLAGDALHNSKRDKEAQEAYARGVAVYTKLSASAPLDLEIRLRLADSLREAGDLDRALEEYNRAAARRTAQTTRELQANLALGVSKLAKLLRQTEQVERAYRQAIAIREPLLSKTTPTMRRAQAADYHDMAFILAPAKRFVQAEQAVRAGLQLHQALADDFPDERDWRMHVVHSYLGLGHIVRDAGRTDEAVKAYGEAAKILDELGAQDPLTTEPFSAWRGRTLWDMSNAWGSLKRFDDAQRCHLAALKVFQLLAAQHPSNPYYRQEQAATHRWLAGVAQSAGRSADAHRHYAQSFDIYKRLVAEVTDPTFYCQEMLHAARGMMFAMAAAPPAERQTNAAHMQAVLLESEQTLTQMIAKQPASPAFLKMHVDLLRWRERDDEALEALNKFIAVEPAAAEAWVARGWLHDKLRQWDKSEVDFSKVIELRPEWWEGWSGRAFSHFHRQQWDQAIADFSKAIELEPTVHMNWLHRGYVYLHRAQWDEAMVDFTKLVDQWPHDTMGWYCRGLTFAQLNEPAKAVADLREAILKGYSNVEQLKTDRRIDPIRGSDGFKQLLADLEKRFPPPGSSQKNDS